MSVALHTLQPAEGSRRGRKRVGRGNGSGHGTFSTRGAKGQRARSGGRSGLKKKGMKRIIAALPKLGGFVSRVSHPASVTVGSLSRVFVQGDIITLRALKKKGLIPAGARGAKIIGTEKVGKALTIAGLVATPAARAVIEAAGGSFTEAKKGV